MLFSILKLAYSVLLFLLTALCQAQKDKVQNVLLFSTNTDNLGHILIQ